MDIKIKKTRPEATVPTRGSAGAAGLDLYSTMDAVIWPGDTLIIPSGIAFEIPEGYFGALYSRSGLSTKKNLRIASGTSVIDEDFRQEIGIPLFNDSSERQYIHKGERVAQIVIQPYVKANLVESDNLSETDRTGGFGSTGRF